MSAVGDKVALLPTAIKPVGVTSPGSVVGDTAIITPQKEGIAIISAVVGDVVVICRTNGRDVGFVTGNAFQPATARWACGACYTESGYIILAGGSDAPDVYLNDAWWSVDGSIWSRVTADAEWSDRAWTSLVAMHDGSIVILNGYPESHDVWRSTNLGLTWIRQVEHAGWEARARACAVCLSDDKLLIFGGGIPSNVNDVWSSTDYGVTWTRLPDASWAKRTLASAIVTTDDKIVLMGGYTTAAYHDVWISINDGVSWTRQTNSPGFGVRYGHTSVYLSDGSIVLMGGSDSSHVTQNDVWRSTDLGVTWVRQVEHAEWSVRTYPSAIVLPGDIILLLCGATVSGGGGYLSEVWQSTDKGVSWTKISG